MKRIFIFLFALCTLSSLAQDRIMVIADPHVLPQTVIGQEADFDAYMAKQRKMVDLSEPIWHALEDTAMKYRPSLILIPGDLTRDGEQAAHDTVSATLQRLQQAGIRTLVIPGNHDLAGTNWETLYPGTFENAVKDPKTKSFAVTPLQGLTVIGIDGSNGTAGTGQLSSATLSFILAQADSARAKGHTIIAMSHWQILEHFDQQGTLESSCRFKNADALRDSLMHHGVHVVLTGHFHVNGITTFRDTTGLTTDSLVEITTGSPITYPCPYRWLTLSEDRADISIETEYITSVDTISDLLTYSREWMKEHTANMIPTLALKVWNKVDSKWDTDVVPALQAMGFSSITIYAIKKLLPQTDEERIDMTQRHLGQPAIDLYIFHSEANENERPALGDSLANNVYTGMNNMIDEIFGGIEVSVLFGALAERMAQEPVQSIVEDRTCRTSIYADQTNDLQGTLHVNAPQYPEAIEQIETHSSAQKIIQNGQLFIRRGDQIYNANGIRIVQ